MRLIAIILLLANVAIAQQVPTPETTKVRGFLGLNTITPDELTDSRYFRVAHNVDWSRHGIPSWGMRFGYDSVSKKSGIDSLLGIHRVTYNDETSQLLFTGDSSSVGYGFNYICALNQNNLTTATRVNIPISVIDPPSYASYEGVNYMVHNSAFGVASPKGYPELAHPFPLPPPGCPLVTPLKSAGMLSGTYRYAFVMRRTGDDSNTVITADGQQDTINGQPFFGALTPPVAVANGAVLLSRFEIPNKKLFGNVNTKDTCRIIILRTVGTFAPLDQYDSLYVVDTVRLDSSNYQTVQYIDTISDVTVRTRPYVHVGQRALGEESGLISNGTSGSPADNFFALGQPSLISFDSCSGNDSGIWQGSGYKANTNTEASTIVGWAWTCVYVDTMTGLVSDTGATFTVYPHQGFAPTWPTSQKVVLQAPRSPMGGVKVDWYRAPIEKIGLDSTTKRVVIYETNPLGIKIPVGTKLVATSYVFDTIVAYRFYHIRRTNPGDTIVDRLPYDSLLNHDPWRRGFYPSRPSQVFVGNKRLYTLSNDFLYYSNIDSFALGSVLSFQRFATTDGDKITAAWPNQRGIAVKKFKESGQMYDDNTKVEPNDGYGCVAARSHVKVEGGDYFLSRNDLIFERESDVLERRFVPTKVSQTLKNFSQLNDTLLAKAVSAYLPSQRQLLTCIGDTTYCFDEQTNAWSTWSFKFAGSTLFGVDSTRRGIPSDTLYFFRPGGTAIYRYGTSNTDNGTTITASAITAPLPVNDGWWKSVQGAGIYLSSLDSSNLLVRTRTENNGTVVETHTFTDPYLRRYRRAKFGGKEQAFWHLEFTGTGLYRTAISGYDLIYDRKGSMEDK